MARAALAWSVVFLSATLSGCLGGGEREESARVDAAAMPPGWDEPTPAVSRLADVPVYPLVHSSTFLLKGQQYGRYIVEVPELLEDVQLFFTTGNTQPEWTTAPQVADIRTPDPDADEFHFEFIQVRPLGLVYKTTNINARAEFGHAQQPGLYTLTYLYGKGIDRPFLAPYDGDPRHWRFEPGLYEFVLATDEAITIGVNVHTGSDFWTTYYHPQEVGLARAEALDYEFSVLTPLAGAGQIKALELANADLARAQAGETLNYFAFANLWYDTQGFALDAVGEVTAGVDGAETSQRLAVTSHEPVMQEAYAYAVHFNHPGPLKERLTVGASFREDASAQSTAGVSMLLFAVALHPLATVEGVAQPPSAQPPIA